MVTVSDVVGVLRECLDPELGANIVDMGLVYEIRIIDGRDVKVKMTMTSPMCPLTGGIVADAQIRLGAIPGVAKADVELVWEPRWSPEMMSSSLGGA